MQSIMIHLMENVDHVRLIAEGAQITLSAKNVNQKFYIMGSAIRHAPKQLIMLI